MTTRLVASIPNGATVAVSRLLDPDVWNQVAAHHTIHEIPHIRCDPVRDAVESSTLHLRCWPNIGGRLEPGTSDDLVAWFPSLVPRPDCGTLVEMDTDPDDALEQRVVFLRTLVRHLEQIRGVSAACSPQAPRTIIYTPGVDQRAVGAFADRYQGSLAPTPSRLAEFPGGISITITTDVLERGDDFAVELTALLRG